MGWMLVKDTLDRNGNLLKREKIRDEEPDFTNLINYHVKKLVELTGMVNRGEITKEEALSGDF